MTAEAFARARQAAIDRLVRERSELPIDRASCEPMLKPGDVIPLTIEKPAAGGR